MAAKKRKKEVRSVMISDSTFAGAFLNVAGDRVYLEFLDGDNYGHAVALEPDAALRIGQQITKLAWRAKKKEKKTDG